MTMTKYVPTWERSYDPWDREPEYWENEELENENEKVSDELSFDDLVIEEMELEESEFDNDLEQNYNYTNSEPASVDSSSPKVVHHSVTLTGLTPGTKYYFRVLSAR